MATFGQMKTWVSKRLIDSLNTSVSSDDVGDLINMALSYWKQRRFWFNEATDVIVLVAGNPTVPLPSNFLVPSIDDAFVIEYSGIRYPLTKVSESEYNAMYLSNGIGQPEFYARQANTEFQVYPIPDRDYDLRRFYLKDYTDFTDDSSSNDFSINAPNLIQYQAAAYGMRDFRQDVNMFEAFQVQTQREYQNLLVRTRKDNATGSLAVYSSFSY